MQGSVSGLSQRLPSTIAEGKKPRRSGVLGGKHQLHGNLLHLVPFSSAADGERDVSLVCVLVSCG